MAAAATAYSRLADAGRLQVPTLPKVPEEIADTNEVFAAPSRIALVPRSARRTWPATPRRSTGKDDVKAEKAAFMIARMGKAGLAELAKHVGYTDPAVRMTVLFGIGHSGDKTCKELFEAIEKQLDYDKGKTGDIKVTADEARAVRTMIISH